MKHQRRNLRASQHLALAGRSGSKTNRPVLTALRTIPAQALGTYRCHRQHRNPTERSLHLNRAARHPLGPILEISKGNQSPSDPEPVVPIK